MWVLSLFPMWLTPETRTACKDLPGWLQGQSSQQEMVFLTPLLARESLGSVCLVCLPSLPQSYSPLRKGREQVLVKRPHLIFLSVLVKCLEEPLGMYLRQAGERASTAWPVWIWFIDPPHLLLWLHRGFERGESNWKGGKERMQERVWRS